MPQITKEKNLKKEKNVENEKTFRDRGSGFAVKRNGFTLIELLVVVAIIGILAAVGTVAYNGYTIGAKKNVTMINYKAIDEKVIMQLRDCEINGRVELMRIPNNTTLYNVDCALTNNHNLYMIDLINHMNNLGNPKNPYGDQSDGGIGTDDAYVKSHPINATQDHIIGFVTVYTQGPNKLILHACFQTPCSNSSNRLYNEIDLP